MSATGSTSGLESSAARTARISDPKVKLSVVDLVIDKLDTHGVPRHDQALVGRIPNSKTKHAIETIEDISAPFFVAVNDHFRVGIRSELMALALQFRSQFLVIVNLAIENYPHGFFCIRHRLVTAGEIDDR